MTTPTGQTINWPVGEAVPLAVQQTYYDCTRLSEAHEMGYFEEPDWGG